LARAAGFGHTDLNSLLMSRLAIAMMWSSPLPAHLAASWLFTPFGRRRAAALRRGFQ